MDTGLKNKNVLITGASQRMGKLAALTFAREGANLAICTSTKMKELNEVADEARALGVKAVAEKCDITVATDVAAFVASAARQLGSIDVVINTAGYRCESPLLEMDIAEWHRSIEVNLTGPMLICRSVIPHMMERRWGRIINLSGLTVHLGDSPSKSMIKSGIVGFTRAVAKEFGKYNITANCVAPGGGGGGGMPPRPEQSIPRNGTMDEFVSLMIYLASEKAGFITGQCYLVEGGTRFH